MRQWWLMAAVLLALSLPATSPAGDLQFWLEDAGQGGVEPSFDVRAEGVARAKVQFIHLEIHELSP